MILTETIARLAATVSPPFALVEGAAELAAVRDAPLAMPAVYVFIAEETSEPNERITTVRQLTHVDIGLVIFTRSLADPRGAAAAEDLESLKATLRTALVGWQPASAETPVEHVATRLVKAAGGVVVAEMTVTTDTYLGD